MLIFKLLKNCQIENFSRCHKQVLLATVFKISAILLANNILKNSSYLIYIRKLIRISSLIFGFICTQNLIGIFPNNLAKVH
jgi:hypothetical protein